MSTKCIEIENAVYKWLCLVRNPHGRFKPLPVSCSAIHVRALREAQLRGVNIYKASFKWIEGWRNRFHILNSVRLHGEGGEVNLVEAEKKMEELRDELSVKGFAVENVFNMDETGIFFRALPSTSFEFPGSDKWQTGRGTKALSAKDRVTLLLYWYMQTHSINDWVQQKAVLKMPILPFHINTR